MISFSKPSYVIDFSGFSSLKSEVLLLFLIQEFAFPLECAFCLLFECFKLCILVYVTDRRGRVCEDKRSTLSTHFFFDNSLD